MQVKVRRMRASAVLPQYMSEGASGLDVCACLDAPIELKSGQRVSVPTGLQVEIPKGFEIQVRPRSGLSYRRGVTVVNAPGTIDSDFRGEVAILLVNLGDETVRIDSGDRVAQWVLQRVEQIEWDETANLNETARGEKGFGSTGIGT